MLSWSKQLVIPPVFDVDELTRTAGLLNTILLVIVGAVMFLMPFVFISEPENFVLNFSTMVPPLVIALALLWLSRYAWGVKPSAVLLSIMLLFVAMANVWLYDGTIQGVNVTSYFVVIVVAGLLLGGRGVFIFCGLSMLSSLGIYYAERDGLISSLATEINFIHWFMLSFMLVVGPFRKPGHYTFKLADK